MKSVRECLYRRDLDIETLVCTRGAALPISMLPERLRCPRCGSRKVALVYEPPSGRDRAAG